MRRDGLNYTLTTEEYAKFQNELNNPSEERQKDLSKFFQELDSMHITKMSDGSYVFDADVDLSADFAKESDKCSIVEIDRRTNKCRVVQR